MNLKGGVIVIGSLYWDSNPTREKWRRENFKNISDPASVRVKLRYGRISSSRENTYTMIFSNHPSTKFGKGLLLEFKQPIRTAKALLAQAHKLALAEGIAKENKPRLSNDWGSVGLLINPQAYKNNAKDVERINRAWAEHYQSYADYNPDDYIVTKKEPLVITQEGLLNLNWTKQMGSFDFLLAAVTKPNTARQVTAKQIADRIKETGSTEYFEQNRINGITTFQDKDILKYLLIS